MFNSAKNIYRLLQITRTLAQHDALFPLEETGIAKGMIATVRLLSRKGGEGRPGQRLAGALQELGPSFVKMTPQTSGSCWKSSGPQNPNGQI